MVGTVEPFLSDQAEGYVKVPRLAYAWYLLRRNALSIVGLVLILILILTAAFADWIAPYHPLATDPALQLNRPSWEYLLGTDNYGRDIFSRVVHASRIDLFVAMAATGIAIVVGATLGAFSGYIGKRVDNFIMRVIDVIMSFPDFILAMGITAVLGNNMYNVIYAISITHIPLYARLVRGEMLHIKETEYAEAAVSVGNPRRRVIFYHLLPNAFPPVIIQATLGMGYAILTVAGLSFIGLGVQPPYSEWGYMTAEGADYIISGEWWLALFPGLSIVITVLGFNLFGDGLRDVLDPKMRK